MLAELISGALAVLPTLVGNMLAVLLAALVSVFAISFFRGEVTTFRNLYVLIIFVTGTLNPIVGLLGGTSTVLLAQRKREEDQRELLVLFTLLLLCFAYFFGLIKLDLSL